MHLIRGGTHAAPRAAETAPGGVSLWASSNALIALLLTFTS